jgi:6-phosphogluconate dehydrogenase
MQLIAESYTMMKDLLGMSHTEISQTFKDWNGPAVSNIFSTNGSLFSSNLVKISPVISIK